MEISGESLWRGLDLSDGFLMKGDRIPALVESDARCVIDAANPLSEPYVVPWGSGLWLDQAQMENQPHTVHAEKPSKGVLTGLLKFEQGWQTGNPVVNWGAPPYTRMSVIRKGLVGYKVALASLSVLENYVAYLKGERTDDAKAAINVYKDWVATWAAGAADSRLGLFFENTSGLPIVSLVTTPASPTLAGASFAGFAEVFEPENATIFFDINL
jgi:hypothetical protein